MDWLVYVIGGLFIAGVGLCVWMFLIEPRCYRIWHVVVPRTDRRGENDVAVRTGRLPRLRILHITDTHFRERDSAKLDFLRRVSDDDYDLVFLTGDLIETPGGLGPCVEMAQALHARCGTYAVLGGHDHFRGTDLIHKYFSLGSRRLPPPSQREANPTARLRTELVGVGVDVLADENRRIEVSVGRDLAIIGLRDAFCFDCNYEAAWDGVRDGEPTIVIAHSPDVLEEVRRRGADLAFFGHTHGGQVRFPVIGTVLTRSNLEPARARGVFREGETVFSINRGVGAGWGSNFRLLCPPEVTVMDVS